MKKLALALVLLLGNLIFAEEYLRFNAPVGTEVVLESYTKTELLPLEYFWPQSLPRPLAVPTPKASEAKGTLRYKVIGRNLVEVSFKGQTAGLNKPIEVTYRVRYEGDRVVVVNPDEVLERLTKSLGLPPESKELLNELLNGLPGFGSASVVPEYSVPLVAGASRTLYVPYIGGKSARVEVTYLGQENGRHHFSLNTYVPYVELGWVKKLLPPGAVSLVSVGPGWTRAETYYFKNGLPAGSISEGKVLSFTYMNLNGSQAAMAAWAVSKSELKVIKP